MIYITLDFYEKVKRHLIKYQLVKDIYIKYLVIIQLSL